MNHERIHLKQQLELLIVPFFIWYLLEWGLKCLIYRSAYRAYQNVGFEREAYTYENDLGYIDRRRPFTFFKHLFRP